MSRESCWTHENKKKQAHLLAWENVSCLFSVLSWLKFSLDQDAPSFTSPKFKFSSELLINILTLWPSRSLSTSFVACAHTKTHTHTHATISRAYTCPVRLTCRLALCLHQSPPLLSFSVSFPSLLCLLFACVVMAEISTSCQAVRRRTPIPECFAFVSHIWQEQRGISKM